MRRGPSARTVIAVLALTTTSLGLCACGKSAQVVRRRGDIETSGRLVSPVAYAWFARGLYHERLGHLEQAARDFGAAVASDKKSGSAWAAWGRVLCSLDRDLAFGAFADGLRRAERKAPVLNARARCHLAFSLPAWEKDPKARKPDPKGKKSVFSALEDAERALLLEPENPETNFLLVECYELLGQIERARSVERAYRLFAGAPEQSPPLDPQRAVDDALSRGDLTAAADHALTSMTPGELAARAALLGQGDIARKQATFVLRANPQDLDAQITLLVLQESPVGTHPTTASSNEGRATFALHDSSHPVASYLSPSATVLFSKHLKRHVGKEAAAHFLRENHALVEAEGDPWLRRLAGEVLKSDLTP